MRSRRGSKLRLSFKTWLFVLFVLSRNYPHGFGCPLGVPLPPERGYRGSKNRHPQLPNIQGNKSQPYEWISKRGAPNRPRDALILVCLWSPLPNSYSVFPQQLTWALCPAKLWGWTSEQPCPKEPLFGRLGNPKGSNWRGTLILKLPPVAKVSFWALP